MKIRLQTLAPVHIGSGEEISPIEYFVEGDKFVRVEMDGLFSDLGFRPCLDSFVKAASAGNRYIGDIVGKKLLLSHPRYILPINSSAKQYLQTNRTIVKAFIKSAGRVFIPGSSLKGSILSAVMYYVLKREPISNLNDFRSLLDKVIASMSSKPQKDRFSRWLDVTDSSFKKPDEVLEVSLN